MDKLEESLSGSATMFERAVNKASGAEKTRAVSFKTNVSRKSGKSAKGVRSDSLAGSVEEDEISYSLSQSAASKLEEQSWNLTATEKDFNGKFGRQKINHSNGVVNEEPIEEEINEGLEDMAPAVEEQKVAISRTKLGEDTFEDS